MSSVTVPAISNPPVLVAPSTVKRRLLALIIGFGCAAVLALAAWLTPSVEGVGTHRQIIGLPPCGWIAAAGIPCPTCGMTTAFAHAADGNLPASFRTQPMGALLALACAVSLLVCVYVAATGSNLGRALGRLWGRRVAWGLCAAFVAAWVFKIILYRRSEL